MHHPKIAELANVYYFNGSLWYQIATKTQKKLVNNRGELKTFIVADITQEKIYSKEDFIKEFFPDGYENSCEVLKTLDQIKYKVFKKIKLEHRHA